MPAAAAVEELQELLLAWEEELRRMEEVLAVWEEKARILEKALTKVSADLTKQAKAEATQKEYLDKMEAHTTRPKHSLGLDKMLGEKKVKLDGREQNLSLREAALVEARSQGLNPRDNHEELMEFVELRRLLQDFEVDRVAEVG
jgi:UDP-N-acetylmuramoylalanine-D-glutamate ligase